MEVVKVRPGQRLVMTIGLGHYLSVGAILFTLGIFTADFDCPDSGSAQPECLVITLEYGRAGVPCGEVFRGRLR